MYVESRQSPKKSWQGSRARVSVLADLAIRKETVVRKLTELRAAHDLTQERAAAKVGVTVRQWQRWEGGASVPYARNLSQVADAFGFDVSEFDDGQGPRELEKPAGVTLADKLDLILENQRLMLTRLDDLERAITEGTLPVNDETAERILRLGREVVDGPARQADASDPQPARERRRVARS